MAKVLYPGKEDFTPRKRERIFREIRNNDWDVVILSHEQFGMIPQSPEIQQEILQAELDCVEENLEVLKAQGRDGFPRHDERVSETQGQPGSQVAEGGRTRWKHARTTPWTSASWVSTTSTWTRATNSRT